MEIRGLCRPFLGVTIAAKHMKCASFPNLALSIPIALKLMNVFPIFNSRCLYLSKADNDSNFNSYLIPYLFHIFCWFAVVFCVFVLI
jgi:hypothetical protein